MPKSQTSHSLFHTDSPTIVDELHFSDFLSSLGGILMQADTPLTVGVFGPWGSGKTSLLRMLRQDIDNKKLPKVRTAWITAWKYDHQEALWRAFILRVLDSLYPRKDSPGALNERPRYAVEELTDLSQKALVEELGLLEENVYRPVDWQELGRLTVDWWQLLRQGGMAAAEVAATFLPGAIALKKVVKLLGGDKTVDDELEKAIGAFRREVKAQHREQLAHIEQFEHTFANVLKLADLDRLIIFVDDLDRCLPEKSIEVLEAIKLFLEVKGTLFVLGMDKKVVELGIQAHYREWFRLYEQPSERVELPLSGDSYLQKMIQIPFYLPPLDLRNVENYILSLELKISPDARANEMTRAVFARGVYPNPRQVKRALNVFRLLRGLVIAREARPVEEGGLAPGKIAWPLLVKTILIQHQWPELYQDWRQYPTLIVSLEQAYERLPESEERVIFGEDEMEEIRMAKEGIPTAAREIQRSYSREVYRGGLLERYFAKRSDYVLLEHSLTYPSAEETGEGRERARFTGMERSEIEAYLLLVSVASPTTPPEELTPRPSEELLSELISGDPARLHDALAQFEEIEPSQKEALRKGLQHELLAAMSSIQRPAKERASAGNALASLGDPRFRADRWYLPDEALLGFVEIPVGTFLMGSDPGKDNSALDEEKPQHEVNLPTYYLARYPVTVAQFRAFMEDRGYKKADEHSLKGTDNHPVVYVSWYDAVAYCKWLTDKLKKFAQSLVETDWDGDGVLKKGKSREVAQSIMNSGDLAMESKEAGFWQGLAQGKLTVTIPSEAEWEKAARGTDARIYPWGDDFDPDRANTHESGLGSTSTVGCFPKGASPYGALDLSGNVWEWTRSLWAEDWQKPAFKYPYDPTDGREKLQVDSETPRVLRGGSFGDSRQGSRCASHLRGFPGYWYDCVGFRWVVSPFVSGL
jgi:formylglycine-generating enzyme required for sulfatase activity